MNPAQRERYCSHVRGQMVELMFILRKEARAEGRYLPLVRAREEAIDMLDHDDRMIAIAWLRMVGAR